MPTPITYAGQVAKIFQSNSASQDRYSQPAPDPTPKGSAFQPSNPQSQLKGVTDGQSQKPAK